MIAAFPYKEAKKPSTWAITYVPDGTEVCYQIDSSDGPEIRLIIGEPELAELAIDTRVATEIVTLLQQAIRECEATPTPADV